MKFEKNPLKIKEPDKSEVDNNFILLSGDDTMICNDGICVDCETTLPAAKSEFTFGNDIIVLKWHKPRPNRWWRFWQYVFFGFKWKDLTK